MLSKESTFLFQNLLQFLHAFGCPFHDVLYLVVAIGIDSAWVYQVDRNVRLGIGNQASGRIDIEGSADDDKDISLLHSLGGRLYHRNILAEENDERTEQTAIPSLGSRLYLAVVLWQFLNIAMVVRVARGANLGEFAM